MARFKALTKWQQRERDAQNARARAAREAAAARKLIEHGTVRPDHTRVVDFYANTMLNEHRMAKLERD